MIKPNFNLTVEANIDGVSKIESNMETVKNQAIEIRDWYSNLVISEDMLDDIKKEKAEINKAKSVVADYRKNIVKEFKKPIEQFETLAKETESLLGEAYTTCNESVKRYEEETKAKKSKEVEEYFNEYAQSVNIDFVNYIQANINVTLTASMKSLKQQAKDFIDKVVSDINLINTQEESMINEILIEYKRTLNVSNSIIEVTNRHKALEEEKKRQEALKELRAKEVEQEKKVEEVIQPKEIIEEQKYKATFTVLGTIEQIKALKEFMNEKGIEYGTK